MQIGSKSSHRRKVLLTPQDGVSYDRTGRTIDLISYGNIPSLRKTKPRIPRGTRVYAIGDIHGRADLLMAMFAAIDDNLKAYPVARPIHVLLGDYIDRGPSSKQVIDCILARQKRHAMVCLKGNHETYAAQFLEDPAILPEWRRLGGVATLASYGVNAPNKDDAETQKSVFAAFRSAMPASHREFIRNLPVTFDCGDYFFVHAGVRPGIPLPKQREEDLLWIREDFLLHEEDFGKIIVHGHSPTKEPDLRPNRINIDTGAFATGRLSCLVLQGSEAFVV
jgi:serine/threonine protein phosphatase 1